MFSNMKLKLVYRTFEDDVDRDFFVPVLRESTIYDRGTGFFTLNGLVQLSQGIIPYLKKGGNIRIITSLHINDKDFELITAGLKKMEDVVQANLLEEINKDLDEKGTLSMDLITNLIAAKRLEIKIAYLPDGIYHEKIGFFRDDQGNEIFFSGSQNATYNAHKENLESITVICSWKGGEDDIKMQHEYFERLWKNFNSTVDVVPFPQTAEKLILEKYQVSQSVEQAIESIEKPKPPKRKLYPYQEEAIQQFLDNNCRHFYEMATGTGKTFTAVKTALRIVESGLKDKLYVMVLVPQIDLQGQWAKAFREEGIEPFLFGGDAPHAFDDEFDRSVISYSTKKGLTVSICVYDTYFSKMVNKKMRTIKNRLFIVDEAHSLSPAMIAHLPQDYSMRLGLSATPEKASSEETKAILDYFMGEGHETYKYSIDQAIEKGFLCHYEYWPLTVHLDEDEYEHYKSLTKTLVALYNAKVRDEKKILDTQNYRAAIVKKCKSKPDKLMEMIQCGRYNFHNAVVYCGQGKDPDTDDKIIDIVTRHLATVGKLNVSQFTSQTINRQAVLESFESGFYDTLAAIKCFDQGVDMPKLDKIYIMASDASKRQTIQRRGRVLRQCTASGKQVAYIYDMIVLPPDDGDEAGDFGNLVGKELNRAAEYGRLANNADYVNEFIEELKEKYNVKEEDTENGDESEDAAEGAGL